MKYDLNLSPCAIRSRRWIRGLLPAGVLFMALALGLHLLALNGTVTEQPAAVQQAIPFTPAVDTLTQLVGVDLGRGRGVESLLAELEAHLPGNARVGRLRYELGEGRAQLDVDAGDEEALAAAVMTLERRFGNVRVLERSVATDGRVSLRVAVQETTGR